MKIVVTGGAGFIGSNFLRKAVKEHPEHIYYCLDSLTYAGDKANLGYLVDGVDYYFRQRDIQDATMIAHCLRCIKPDAIVHFAAETHVCNSIVNPDVFFRTNVLGTMNLLDSVKDFPECVFVHVSTDEVYGSIALDQPAATETTRYNPTNPYSASKAASDHLVQSYHNTFGTRTRITHSTNNYGPGQYPEKLVPKFIANCLANKPLPLFGSGNNVRDWLYVEDNCEAIWQVLMNGKDGEVYNIGANELISNRFMTLYICNVVAEATKVSDQGYLNLIRYTNDRPKDDFRYALDSSKIRRELGWAPKTTLRQGLKNTVASVYCHDILAGC